MDTWVHESPARAGHSGRVRICVQTAFDEKTYVHMPRGKSTTSGSRVSRWASPGTSTTRVTLLPREMSKKAPYKHFRPDQLGATSLRAYAVVYCCFIMADNVEGNSSSKKKGGKRRRSNSREWTWNPEMVESPVNYLKYYKTLCNLNTFDFDGDKVQLYSVLRKRMAAALDICNLYLISTRRIVIILYSAQHWNQHKDAFAWILYRDPCCWKPDEMYTSQRATAWYFSCYPICRVYPSVNDVQSVIYTFKKEKTHSGFQTTYD